MLVLLCTHRNLCRLYDLDIVELLWFVLLTFVSVFNSFRVVMNGIKNCHFSIVLFIF